MNEFNHTVFSIASACSSTQFHCRQSCPPTRNSVKPLTLITAFLCSLPELLFTFGYVCYFLSKLCCNFARIIACIWTLLFSSEDIVCGKWACKVAINRLSKLRAWDGIHACWLKSAAAEKCSRWAVPGRNMQSNGILEQQTQAACSLTVYTQQDLM